MSEKVRMKLRSAYEAYMGMRLRVIEDRWIWDDTEYEQAMMDMKANLEGLEITGYTEHHKRVTDTYAVKWKLLGSGEEHCMIMDEVSAILLIARWEDGEFDNG